MWSCPRDFEGTKHFAARGSKDCTKILDKLFVMCLFVTETLRCPDLLGKYVRMLFYFELFDLLLKSPKDKIKGGLDTTKMLIESLQ